MATEVAPPLLTPPETVQAEQKRLPTFCALNSRSSTEGSTEGAGRICVLSELAFTTGYHSRYQPREGTTRTWCYSLSPIISLVEVHRELLFPFSHVQVQYVLLLPFTGHHSSAKLRYRYRYNMNEVLFPFTNHQSRGSTKGTGIRFQRSSARWSCTTTCCYSPSLFLSLLIVEVICARVDLLKY